MRKGSDGKVEEVEEEKNTENSCSLTSLADARANKRKSTKSCWAPRLPLDTYLRLSQKPKFVGFFLSILRYPRYFLNICLRNLP